MRARIAALELAVLALARVELGDSPGHDFHGNQWTGGGSGSGGVGNSDAFDGFKIDPVKPAGSDELGHYLMDKEGDLMLTKSIESVIDRVASSGGITIEPVTGKEPTTGYIVATQENSKIVEDDVFFDDRMKGVTAIEAYLSDHVEEFDGSGDTMLGIWHDADHGEVVLDVVEHVDDRAEAVQLGTERDQQSVWDVVQGEEIDTGGTGGRES